MTEDELLQPTTFRDTISTVNKKTGVRKWIYALQPKGNFYKYRSVLAYLYLLVFFVIPFIKINGQPVVLINVVKSKFVLLGKVFWPQDFFLFAVGMIAFIVFIVLFTVVFGRLFCGWVCPQTVFMEFYFRKIEWLIEGSPAQQKKLNEGIWTTEKIIKKTVKHFLFILFSFLIAHTFLSYIIGVEEVLHLFKEGIALNMGLFVGLIFFTGLFYAVFAFVREIVCTTICPYGRLQGVMFDENTLLVAYDYNRGEPRGFAKKKEEPTAALGDCIDCHKCVAVCPTGIDIRDGVQLDCVNCTACIDVCDEVMLKLNRAPGLIRYSSENQLKHKKKFGLAFRAKAYIVLLAGISIFLATLILTRKNIELKVYRAKGQTYTLQNDSIVNIFEVKVLNKTLKSIDKAVVTVANQPNASMQLVGHMIPVFEKEAISKFLVLVKIPAKEINTRSTSLQFALKEGDHLIDKSNTKFLGPF